jgi:hypothetical protein
MMYNDFLEKLIGRCEFCGHMPLAVKRVQGRGDPGFLQKLFWDASQSDAGLVVVYTCPNCHREGVKSRMLWSSYKALLSTICPRTIYQWSFRSPSSSGHSVRPITRSATPRWWAAAISLGRVRSAWRTAACSSWTSCLSSTPTGWKRCANRWRTGWWSEDSAAHYAEVS